MNTEGRGSSCRGKGGLEGESGRGFHTVYLISSSIFKLCPSSLSLNTYLDLVYCTRKNTTSVLPSNPKIYLFFSNKSMHITLRLTRVRPWDYSENVTPISIRYGCFSLEGIRSRGGGLAGREGYGGGQKGCGGGRKGVVAGRKGVVAGKRGVGRGRDGRLRTPSHPNSILSWSNTILTSYHISRPHPAPPPK